MDIKDIKPLLDKGVNTIKSDPSLFLEFENIYTALFGNDAALCLSCPDGFESAFHFAEVKVDIALKSGRKTLLNPDAKFLLKKGGTIYVHSHHTSYSQFTITDEIAIDLLKSNENYITSFEKYPSNWREIISNEPSLSDKIKHSLVDLEKTGLAVKSKGELLSYAKGKGYNDNEYKDKNKSELLIYLQNKLS